MTLYCWIAWKKKAVIGRYFHTCRPATLLQSVCASSCIHNISNSRWLITFPTISTSSVSAREILSPETRLKPGHMSKPVARCCNMVQYFPPRPLNSFGQTSASSRLLVAHLNKKKTWSWQQVTIKTLSTRQKYANSQWFYWVLKCKYVAFIYLLKMFLIFLH